MNVNRQVALAMLMNLVALVGSVAIVAGAVAGVVFVMVPLISNWILSSLVGLLVGLTVLFTFIQWVAGVIDRIEEEYQ